MLKNLKPEFPLHAVFKLVPYVVEETLRIIEEKTVNIL